MKKYFTKKVGFVMTTFFVVTSMVATIIFSTIGYSNEKEAVFLSGFNPYKTQVDSPVILPITKDDAGPIPTSSGIESAISVLAAKYPNLSVQVSDVDTDKVIWSYQDSTPMIPASLVKILTAAAALKTLSLEARIPTYVYGGGDILQNAIVLKGEGDVTLQSPQSTAGMYTDAPKLSNLADQIKSKMDPNNIKTIYVDQSYYQGADFAQGWYKSDINGGSITPVSPVMVDAGRVNPNVTYSPRFHDPGLQAGKDLATALGLKDINVEYATSGIEAQESTSTQIAEVESATLKNRLSDMLLNSDDVLAQSIGIEVAAKLGYPHSIDGSVKAVETTLKDAGYPIDGLKLEDTNGLSVNDRVMPITLSQVLIGAAGDTKNTAETRVLLSLLPTSGATGTLEYRFKSPETKDAGGFIKAKTGTLTGVNSLAGVVTDTSKRTLVFVLMSNTIQGSQADIESNLDEIAAALYGCGCNQ